MSIAYDSSELIKDFQKNLVNFINAVQTMAICTQNIAKIMGNVDNSQTLPLLDWSQNLFALVDAFETDAKAQLTASNEKENSQPETCSMARLTMSNIYSDLHFFLNHMTHSYIDLSRSESPMSASFECQTQNMSAAQQHNRIRNIFKYRRWSEVPFTSAEPYETVDNNRRWSMPANCTKAQSRFIPMMNKLAGLVNQSQTTIPDQIATNSDGVIEAIQLLSFKAHSRPPSQHCQQSIYSSQQQHFRSQRQRQPRGGEINEILVLPRPNDSLYLGRYQQIVENIRGESCDEY